MLGSHADDLPPDLKARLHDAPRADRQELLLSLHFTGRGGRETDLLGIALALGGQVSLLHGGIERIQSRAQGRWFLGVATSQGPDALLARASSLADQVQVLGYLAPG